jgi:hypothetical protein
MNRKITAPIPGDIEGQAIALVEVKEKAGRKLESDLHGFVILVEGCYWIVTLALRIKNAGR